MNGMLYKSATPPKLNKETLPITQNKNSSLSKKLFYNKWSVYLFQIMIHFLHVFILLQFIH